MIEVNSLSRNYGKLLAVDDVSFTIADHQIVGLLGHNGAGKTTIMKMLSGYLEPAAGSIAINGLDLAEDARAIQRQLGYLPENLPVYPDMRVADYLDYAATLKGIATDKRIESVHDAIEATGLQERCVDPIHTLSRGLKQRVGVAQAILGNPQFLILDEPSNGLDPDQTENMRKLIRRLARHATVILSTHIMQEVDALCDRVLMLRGGRLALDADLESLRQSHSLLLRAERSDETLQHYLGRLPQIASVTQIAETEGCRSFRLALRDKVDIDTAANNIAQCVLEAGARLYELQPERRDLQTVFRTITRGEVLTDV